MWRLCILHKRIFRYFSRQKISLQTSFMYFFLWLKLCSMDLCYIKKKFSSLIKWNLPAFHLFDEHFCMVEIEPNTLSVRINNPMEQLRWLINRYTNSTFESAQQKRIDAFIFCTQKNRPLEHGFRNPCLITYPVIIIGAKVNWYKCQPNDTRWVHCECNVFCLIIIFRYFTCFKCIQCAQKYQKHVEH